MYPGGKKAFVLSYRTDGRKRLMTLGDYGVLNLDQARDIARKKLAEVLDGKDPLEAKRRAAKAETVRDVCAA